MKRGLVIFQILNVIGICNFLTVFLMQNIMGPKMSTFAFKYSVSVVIISLFMVALFSIRFLSQVGKHAEHCSSILSPFYRYILVNPAIASFFSMIGLGLFYKIELLKVALFILVSFGYPLWIFLRSEFVVLRDNVIQFYNYSNEYTEVKAGKILGVKRALLGVIYKIVFIGYDGRKKIKFFFPGGGFLLGEPTTVKRLKDLIHSMHN